MKIKGRKEKKCKRRQNKRKTRARSLPSERKRKAMQGEEETLETDTVIWKLSDSMQRDQVKRLLDLVENENDPEKHDALLRHLLRVFGANRKVTA